MNIIDIIAHKLLVRTSGNSQAPTVDWSRLLMEQCEFQRQRNSRHFDDILSCRWCGELGVSQHVHLETHRQAHQQVHDARTCLNVISGRSRPGSCLVCLEFSDVPTGGGTVAEDMTTDSEVYHTFGHHEDERRDAGMLVTGKILLRVCSTTL